MVCLKRMLHVKLILSCWRHVAVSRSRSHVQARFVSRIGFHVKLMDTNQSLLLCQRCFPSSLWTRMQTCYFVKATVSSRGLLHVQVVLSVLAYSFTSGSWSHVQLMLSRPGYASTSRIASVSGLCFGSMSKLATLAALPDSGLLHLKFLLSSLAWASTSSPYSLPKLQHHLKFLLSSLAWASTSSAYSLPKLQHHGKPVSLSRAGAKVRARTWSYSGLNKAMGT